jgi:hypothetical protein
MGRAGSWGTNRGGEIWAVGSQIKVGYGLALGSAAGAVGEDGQGSARPGVR